MIHGRAPRYQLATKGSRGGAPDTGGNDAHRRDEESQERIRIQGRRIQELEGELKAVESERSLLVCQRRMLH